MRYRLASAASFVTTLALFACGPASKRPSDADITAYLNQSQPSYVHIAGVTATFDAIKPAANGQTVAGSWRVSVDFTLQTQQDLYGPAADTSATRLAFDRAVSASEGFRPARIAAVNQVATQAGLLAKGAANPEPAIVAVVVNPKGAVLHDHVTLLAQPDGAGWKFFQLDAQSLSDSAIGSPLDDVRRAYAHDIVVLKDSPEAASFAAREKKFLEALARAGKP